MSSLLPTSPGRAIMALGAGHAVWGAVAYGDALREIARAGVVDSVGDGLFAREHAHDARAAAFWFMFVAPMVGMVGYEVERAAAAGDGDAVTRAGWGTLVLCATGVVAMPRSGFPGGVAIALWTIREGRRLRGRSR